MGHALDPPEQPYNINVVDFDKKWAKLDWTVATGPRATNFVVEKCETFLIPKDEEQEYVEYCSGWMVAGITEDDTPEIKIDSLTEGYKYQFRVKAQNKAGISYP